MACFNFFLIFLLIKSLKCFENNKNNNEKEEEEEEKKEFHYFQKEEEEEICQEMILNGYQKLVTKEWTYEG